MQVDVRVHHLVHLAAVAAGVGVVPEAVGPYAPGEPQRLRSHLLRLVWSGYFDTPWERMQRAKLSASWWSWSWICAWFRWPAELDELGELEAHAAVIVEAAMAAAVRRVGGHARRGRRVTRVLSSIARRGRRVTRVLSFIMRS